MEVLKDAPKAHAKFSASGSERWLECPGSIPLTEQVADLPVQESKYAKEGTDAHAALEHLVKNRKKRLSAIEFLRKKYPLQMIIHAEEALDYIEKRLQEYPDAELYSENKVALPVSLPDQFGTTDIVIAEHFGRLIVIDYKYGAGIAVDPEENSQLIYYALGVAHQFDYNFTEVELVIIQPRTPFGSPVKSWVTDIATLDEWRDTFERGIQLALSKDPPLKAGDHCRFCPAKIICPEIKNKALRSAQAAFDDETGELDLPVPGKTRISLPVVLPALDKLETWIAAVREYAENLLNAGFEIDGYHLVEKRGQRKWIDAEKVAKLAHKKFGVWAFTEPELLSPAQLEKVETCGVDLKAAKAFVEKHSAIVSSGVKLERKKEEEEPCDLIKPKSKQLEQSRITRKRK